MNIYVCIYIYIYTYTYIYICNVETLEKLQYLCFNSKYKGGCGTQRNSDFSKSDNFKKLSVLVPVLSFLSKSKCQHRAFSGPAIFGIE